MQWTRSRIWTAALIGTAIYFSAALWLKYSEPNLVGVSGHKLRLYGNFVRHGFGFAFVANPKQLGDLWDSMDFPQRSPVMLYEDDRPLGPAHSDHIDIEKFGHGRFCQLENICIVF
jgi:hypothetical protein